MSYLILDIETVTDHDSWEAPEPAPPSSLEVMVKDLHESLIRKAESPNSKRRTVISAVDKTKIVPPPGFEEKEEEISSETALVQEEDLDEIEQAIAAVESTRVEEKKPYIQVPTGAQRVIVIGCLFFDNNFIPRKIGVMGDGELSSNEPELLARWSSFMGRERPMIVTWNGRGFDLPVLTTRAFKHGVPIPWYFADRNYRYRYSIDKHCDLMDAMSDYGATSRLGFRLDFFARQMGLPGKYGVDGSQVGSLFADGRIKEIEIYCMTDVAQTAFIFLRYMLLRGRSALPAYREHASRLLAMLDCQPRLKEFCDLIDRKTLLLGEEYREPAPLPSSSTTAPSTTAPSKTVPQEQQKDEKALST